MKLRMEFLSTEQNKPARHRQWPVDLKALIVS